jgi:hypothetical protein
MLETKSGRLPVSAPGHGEIPTADLRTPERHGEVLCVPPLSAWVEVARRNADLLDRAPLRLGGVPLSQLRAESRRELLGVAGAFLARVGETPRRFTMAEPLLVTGHQPLFFHPGIWIKNLLVQSCVEEGAAGVNLIVDTDDFGDLDVALPRRNGRLETARRRLLRCPPDVPFEAAPVPSPAEWERFVDALRADVQTLGLGRLVERVGQLGAAGERALLVAENLGEFMALVRRSLESADSAPAYLELPVSALSRTCAFRRFATWIVRHTEAFRECHNRALDAHREAEGLRSPAQPFPNLRMDEQGCELPFWIVRGGRRWPARAVRRDGEISLRAGAEEVATLEESDDAALDTLASVELRPRALTLTMFARICFGDLFVHGIGGGRYDRATDRVIADLFEIPPPAFAVASATFHLQLARHADPRADRLALERKLLDLRHNPDRYLDDGDAAVHALVEEKWQRIRELELASLTRRKRREVTHRIRAINQALAAKLENEIRAIEEELLLIAAEQTEHEIATLRTYPFFLFDAGELRATVVRACAAEQP